MVDIDIDIEYDDIDIDMDEDMDTDIDLNIYNQNIEINDIFIIYFDNSNGSIIKIKDIDIEEKVIYIDYDKIDTLKLNDDYKIILTTDDYEIIDIEKIIKIDYNEIDKYVNVSKNYKDDIVIETKEVENYIYNENDKIESLISSLINSLDIYDNKNLIYLITEISIEFIDLIKSIDKSIDNEGHFYDILNYKKYKKLPDWLIPISNNIKRLYTTDIQNKDDYFTIDFEEQFKELYELRHDSKDLSYTNALEPYYLNKYLSMQYNDIDNGILIEYDNDYLRSCLIDKICTGINIEDDFTSYIKYSIDNRRNHKGLKYPLTLNNNTTLELLFEKQKLNLNSLLYITDNNLLKLKIDINTNVLSLSEKCILINKQNTVLYNDKLNYILKNNFKKINTNNDILEEYISSKNHNSKNSYEYELTESVDINEFHEILMKYIPTPETIINKSVYKKYYSYIFNYFDFYKLMLRYDIRNNINSNIKININEIINKNTKKFIDSYKKSYGILKYNKNIITVTYSYVDKLTLLKNYIYQLSNIEYKIDLLTKFINSFTRSSNKLNEDPKYLYLKYSNHKSLCCHYKYYIKQNTDNTAYDTMLNIYATQPIDGIIYCNNCNEYLNHDHFSNFDGFKDDMPIIKETLKIEEKIEYKKDDLEIINIIKLLSNNFNINLIDTDINEIVQLYNITTVSVLADIRYEDTDIITKNHIKIINAVNKIKAIEYIIDFMRETNKIIFILSTIIIYIQTSIQSYTINSDKLLNLLEVDFYNNIKINNNLIEKILNKLKKMCISFKKEKTWKYTNDYLEEENDPDIIHPKEQMKNIILYLLSPSFSKIKNRIDNYRNYNNISININIKEYWTIYKPLPTNKNIIKINNNINKYFKENEKYMIKNTNTKYNLENITLLQELNNFQYIYKLLDIKNIDLLNNKSFLQLYDLVLTLNGYQIINNKKNTYIELLVNRLINTTTNKVYFTNLFKKYNWKQNNKISFKEFRNILYDINDYCKSNNECIKTLNIFNHKSFNNMNLCFLSIYPKRIYKYTPPMVLPYKSYDELEDDNPIKDLFYKYCYDINGKLIKRHNKKIIKNEKIIYEELVIINSIYIDNDIKYNECETLIEPTNENYIKIINTFYKQNSFDKIYYIKPHLYNNFTIDEIIDIDVEINIINRLIQSLNTNNYKHIEILKNIYELSLNYNNDYDSDINYHKLYDDYFSKLIEDTYDMLQNITDYLINTDNLTDKHKKMINLSKLFIKSNEKELPSGIFIDLLDNTNTDTIKLFIKNIIFILSRIKNKNNKDTPGCEFYNSIPKTWNLSDYNNTKMKEFISNREYLLHNSIFVDSGKYKGFLNYLSDQTNSICFKRLYIYIKPFVDNINYIVGKNNNLFTKQYENILIHYLFIYLLNKIVEFINMDNDYIEYTRGNEIFQSLEKLRTTDNTECNEKISGFLLDIIINIVQESNDPTWYIHIQKINNLEIQISQQKEKEKQVHLAELTSMDNESRRIYKQKENAGMLTVYKDFALKNAEFVESKEYSIDINEQRLEAMKQILSDNQSELDANQTDTDDFKLLEPDTQDKGYSGLGDFDADDDKDDY